MGLYRPRYLVFGLLVLVAVLWSQGTSGSEPVRSRTERGEVSASGAVTGAEGWQVVHRAPGVYRVVVAHDDPTFDVPAWNLSADVTILPLGNGAADIEFRAGNLPVDTDFELLITIDR